MNLLHLLFFKGSRKMGFALWLFITANIYLWVKLINADMWMNCVLLVSCLVGGGTAFDRWINTKKLPGQDVSSK
jgi:hypothetical protein